MDPRLQVAAVLFLAIVCIALGLYRGYRRGKFSLSDKVDYTFVLKVILGGCAIGATTASFLLTLAFIATWWLQEDLPGAAPAAIETLLPRGYPIQALVGLAGVGALCTFATAVIAYLDHVNTG